MELLIPLRASTTRSSSPRIRSGQVLTFSHGGAGGSGPKAECIFYNPLQFPLVHQGGGFCNGLTEGKGNRPDFQFRKLDITWY